MNKIKEEKIYQLILPVNTIEIELASITVIQE